MHSASGSSSRHVAKRPGKSAVRGAWHIADWLDSLAACPWPAHAGSSSLRRSSQQRDQGEGRAAAASMTPWLAMLVGAEFALFVLIVALGERFLMTGHGFALVADSMIAKSLLYVVVSASVGFWESAMMDPPPTRKAVMWASVLDGVVAALQVLTLAAIMFSWWSPTTRVHIGILASLLYLVRFGHYLDRFLSAAQPRPSVLGRGFTMRGPPA
jgi:hypothetical protein